MELYAARLGPRHFPLHQVSYRRRRARAFHGNRLNHTKTDVELMRAICAGDQSSLGEVYGRYATALHAVGRNFRLSNEELSDVVHDVFLEVWQKAHEFDPERGSLLTWLAVRLRSRCIDRIRKENRRSDLLKLNPDAIRPRDVTPPGPATVQRSRLRQAVHDLDDDLREVTKLAYFDGVSTSEIATHLDIPHGTVKSRIRRAREILYIAMTEAL